jgi:hypothetical protein
MIILDELLTDTAIVDDLAPATACDGRALLDAAVAQQAQSARASLLGSRGTRRRRLRIATVMSAAAAAVVITPIVALGNGQPSASASAATLLREAGRAAAAQPGGWPDASYWHSVSTYLRDGSTHRRDIWIGHHAPSVLRDSGYVPAVVSVSGSFPAGSVALTWDQLYALPTDPDTLAATLRADIHGAGSSDDAELFVMVGDLLRESPAPPELRQALYEVAAGIPGVRSTGQITDSQGRTGTGIERDGQRYIIDTSTGQLLDETQDGWQSTYLSQGPADSAPPAGRS